MLDRTPTGRRRNQPYVDYTPPEIKALRRIMKMFERLTLGATVVHTEEQGVLVQYDPKDSDRLSSLLAALEDDEDGNDLEPSSGELTMRRYGGVLYDIDDDEHDGGEPEEAEPSMGWTDTEARWGKYALWSNEPSLGSLERVDQSKWAASSTTDDEQVNEDGGDVCGAPEDTGLCGFAPFDGIDQTKGYGPPLQPRQKRKVVGVLEPDGLRVMGEVVTK